MALIPLDRVDFIHPINIKGGGVTGLVIDKATVDLQYDLATLTVRILRLGVFARIPMSNVKSMIFHIEAPLGGPDVPVTEFKKK